MPEQVILQCYSCHMYQVQQAKKTAKWTCVICGSKQSILKVHARSATAGELRPTVQRLNLARGLAEAAVGASAASALDQDPPIPDTDRHTAAPPARRHWQSVKEDDSAEDEEAAPGVDGREGTGEPNGGPPRKKGRTAASKGKAGGAPDLSPGVTVMAPPFRTPPPAAATAPLAAPAPRPTAVRGGEGTERRARWASSCEAEGSDG